MLSRDPVLSRLWHPVLRSNELTDRPLSVEVLGERAAVFRTEFGVHAVKDLCVHRGVPLSLGTVRDNQLVCAYHGWTYNIQGKCTRIPAMPAHRLIPPKACTPVYACAESDGFVWVCIDEPVSESPIIGGGGLTADFKQVFMGPYSVSAAGPRLVENFLDVSHLMFVHEGLLGEPERSEIAEYKVHEVGGMLQTDEIEVYQPDPDGRGNGVNALYTYKVYSPLSASLSKRIKGSPELFHLYLLVLPENEQRSTAYMVMERNYALDVPDDVFIAFQDKLLEQDRTIVENQMPELLPLDLQAELHLKCDRLSIMYRKMLLQAGVTFGTA